MAYDKHFSVVNSQEIQNICQPVLNRLGIDYFHYARIYEDGTATVMLSAPEWYIYHTDNKLPCYVPLPSFNFKMDRMISLWENCAHDKVLKGFYEHLHFYHPISFLEMKNGYTEDFAFASRLNSPKTIENYLNNLVILQKFCNYFVIAAAKLIKEGEREVNRTIMSDEQLAFIHKFPVKPVHSNQRFSQSLINVPGMNVSDRTSSIFEKNFTRREFECLQYLKVGSTVKEIALMLKISPRTVEYYINKIREKFNGLPIRKIISLLNSDQ